MKMRLRPEKKEQSSAGTSLKKRMMAKEPCSRSIPSKRKRSESDLRVQEPQEVSIIVLHFTLALNQQEFEDLDFGSDDEEVKRKKLKVKKCSSSMRGASSGKVAPSVRRGHEGLDVYLVPRRSEKSLVKHFSESQVGCRSSGLSSAIQPESPIRDSA